MVVPAKRCFGVLFATLLTAFAASSVRADEPESPANVAASPSVPPDAEKPPLLAEATRVEPDEKQPVLWPPIAVMGVGAAGAGVGLLGLAFGGAFFPNVSDNPDAGKGRWQEPPTRAFGLTLLAGAAVAAVGGVWLHYRIRAIRSHLRKVRRERLVLDAAAVSDVRGLPRAVLTLRF